jgi:hypothetical protein
MLTDYILFQKSRNAKLPPGITRENVWKFLLDAVK